MVHLLTRPQSSDYPSIKINTLHLHITDAQSWPIQLPDFPELAQVGAYSLDQSFTLDDIQDVTTYAAERGIDVLLVQTQTCLAEVLLIRTVI